MQQLVEDVLIDLILEDVLTDGHLFEMNPFHDAAGKFTSKGATDLYQSGALAFGRAKGMKAKAQGLDQEGIRAAIKGGIEKHLAGKGEREAGAKRLDLVRGMTKRGTLGPAPAPKAPRAPREPGVPKEKQGENMQTFMALVKKQHGEAQAKADDAVRRINAKEEDQIKARQDWNDAHKEMANLRGKLDAVQKRVKGARSAGRPPASGDKSPKIEVAPEPEKKAKVEPAYGNYAMFSKEKLQAHLQDLETQHAKHAEDAEKAQIALRGRATHSEAGAHYQTRFTAQEQMGILQKKMKQLRDVLKTKGA